MSERVQNIFDMFVRTDAFDEANSADYAEFTEAASQFAIVRQVITVMREDFADQLSGARGQAVEAKAAIRAAMRRKLKRFAKVARALNFADPGFRRLFLIPDGNSDQELLGFAREVVEEANKHKTDFARMAITQSKIDALAADITQMEEKLDDKATAHLEGVGATANLDEQLETGMKSETILDAMMEVIYEDDATKIREWKSARHVKSAKKKPSNDAPQT